MIRHWSSPKRLLNRGKRVTGVEFEATRLGADGRLEGTGEIHVLEADVVYKAIGQRVLWDGLGSTAEILNLEHGRIVIDENRRTSLPDVWAGGDCVYEHRGHR